MWGKWPAAMLAIYNSRGVTPEVNLSEHISHTPPWSLNKAEPTLALKPRGDITRSPKQGYQWPQKWTCVQQNFKKTRMYSSRMHTGRTLTVFRWRNPPKIWRPPENFEEPPSKIWRPSPPKFGGTPPGPDTPLVNRMNDRHLWKYYLGQNFVSAGKNILEEPFVVQYKYVSSGCGKSVSMIWYILVVEVWDRFN